jgi:hypothetical protein
VELAELTANAKVIVRLLNGPDFLRICSKDIGGAVTLAALRELARRIVEELEREAGGVSPGQKGVES